MFAVQRRFLLAFWFFLLFFFSFFPVLALSNLAGEIREPFQKHF